MTAQERLEEILAVVRDAHMDAQDNKITWEQALSEVLVTIKYEKSEEVDMTLKEYHDFNIQDTQVLIFQIDVTCHGDEIRNIAQMERNIEEALSGPIDVQLTPEDEDNFAQEIHVEHLRNMTI